MGVKADWHEDAVIDGPKGFDPFGMASSLTVAPIATDIPIEEVRDKLVRLQRRERSLHDRFDLSCPIKDRCDTSCALCPLNESSDEDSVKGMLCKVGLEQEQFETLFAVLQVQPPAPAPVAAGEHKTPLW